METEPGRSGKCPNQERAGRVKAAKRRSGVKRGNPTSFDGAHPTLPRFTPRTIANAASTWPPFRTRSSCTNFCPGNSAASIHARRDFEHHPSVLSGHPSHVDR
jgi:hypothetical protein